MTLDTRPPVAQRIRALRLKLGLSRGHLADKLGIPPSRLGHYETGRHKLPTDVGVKLAKLAKVSLGWLYSEQKRKDK